MEARATGVAIRPARPSDNAALIALDLRSPIVAGAIEVSFDRSPDYFAPARLQSRTRYAVAEERGQPVGVCGSALHRATLLGREWLLAYTHHERIDPDFQRRGIGRALTRWLQQSWLAEGLDSGGTYAYIDSRNEASLAFASSGGGPGPWPVDAWLQELAAIDAEVPRGGSVNPDQAGELACLLNATHAGLELFPGYTAERLIERLERAYAYDWPQLRALRANGRIVAALGLYDQGRHSAAIVRDRATGAVSVSRALVVLDYGYLPGYEGAMLDLLACAQAEAERAGRSTLELSVPECSPLFDRVMERAESHICFKFLGGQPRPPAGYPLRGVYVDPVYL